MFAVQLTLEQYRIRLSVAHITYIIVIHYNIEMMVIRVTTDSNSGYVSGRYNSRRLRVQTGLGV
jgi:hypothetical protein